MKQQRDLRSKIERKETNWRWNNNVKTLCRLASGRMRVAKKNEITIWSSAEETGNGGFEGVKPVQSNLQVRHESCGKCKKWSTCRFHAGTILPALQQQRHQSIDNFNQAHNKNHKATEAAAQLTKVFTLLSRLGRLLLHSRLGAFENMQRGANAVKNSTKS